MKPLKSQEGYIHKDYVEESYTYCLLLYVFPAPATY